MPDLPADQGTEELLRLREENEWLRTEREVYYQALYNIGGWECISIPEDCPPDDLCYSCEAAAAIDAGTAVGLAGEENRLALLAKINESLRREQITELPPLHHAARVERRLRLNWRGRTFKHISTALYHSLAERMTERGYGA
jgi:hypothetical protein